MVITDYAAIQELIAHGVAEDAGEAAFLAMEAGVDIDMKTSCYANELKPLLEDGKISMEKIDQAVWRVLKLKNKLGLFEDPYRGADESAERKLFCCPAHREKARELAAETVVLLENRDGLLPLNPNSIKKAALIGPYGDSKDLMGLWAVHGNRDDTVTLKEALGEALGEERLLTARGCGYLEDESALGLFGKAGKEEADGQKDAAEAERQLQEAVNAAQKADVVIMALGEHPRQSGEGGSRTQPDIPKIQRQLLEEVRRQGKPIVLVLFSGRPLILTDIRQQADAVLEAWFPGTEGGHGLADIIFGKVNPSGRLTMSFPRCAGQMPVYYSHFQTGRPAGASSHSSRFTSRYLDCPNDPLYPFGYGLSYHKASYGRIRLSSDRLHPNETLRAWVEVANESSVAGVEIVQMYIRDVSGSVVRPVKELKGFCRLELKAGERRTAEFEIRQDILKFYGKDMEFRAEPGRFQVMIGRNSQEADMAEFTLLGKE